MEERKEEVYRDNKDRLFTHIFGHEENKKWALELYNAINKSSYSDTEDLQINSIEDFLYIGQRNDVSFIIHDEMNLYEHQSTYNPNMPLRQLMYSGKLYDKYVTQKDLNLFGRNLVKIPLPKLIVFYNGEADCDEEIILKLSDAFIGGAEQKPDIEVTVRMININYGHNMDLLNACNPLLGYSWFVERVRNNQKTMDRDEAVDRAIDDMPEEYVIKPYLVAHRTEIKMSYFSEYDAEKVNQLFYRDGREDGLEEGKKLGRAEGVLQSIKNAMTNLKLTADEAMDALGIASDDRIRFRQML